MNVFDNIWEHIKAFVHGAGDVVAAAVKAFASFIEQNGGDVLVQSALDAVTAAETNGGSGSDKFNAAVSAVKADLSSKGLPVVEHAVQSAVLAAVSEIKTKATADAPAA